MEALILLVIVIYFLRKDKKSDYRYPQKKRKSQRFEQEQWHSEWVWDEKKQLWIHPLSGDTHSTQQSGGSVHQDADIDFSEAYQSKYLLTKNEWIQYKKLKAISDVKGYVICPKVRLFDIIEPKKGHEKYKTLMYKIQAKHIDFLICDQNMHIKAVIELDDRSHDKKDRKERDAFVDLILQSVGYKVIHTRYITNDILDLV